MDNWLKTRGIVLHARIIFRYTKTGPYLAQAFQKLAAVRATSHAI